MRCLLIADDLTGACDAAVQFRRRGANTVVEISPGIHTCEVLAISTDSRGVSADVAEARIQALAERARTWAPEVIFKKVDSLWRGDQAGEIQACKVAFGCTEIIVTPAFPALGRRVANMERELERQNVSIREEDARCTPTTVSTVCEGEWRIARKHDMEQWSASTNASRAERDQWSEWGVFGALACVGLFYGLRLVLTGRIRPLWPLSR